MSPKEIDAWVGEAWTLIAKHLPARDHVIYRIGLLAGIGVFLVNHPDLMPPGLPKIPPEWAKWVNDVSAAVAILSAKLGWSSAKAPAPQAVADTPAMKGAV